MKLIIFLSISLITVLQINAQTNNVPANRANPGTRLSLELIRSEPVPVIDSLHPDARDIPGGFEVGSTLKVSIGGETFNYMISTTMETIRINRWDHMRAEIWTSPDGIVWRRHRTLFRTCFAPKIGLW